MKQIIELDNNNYCTGNYCTVGNFHNCVEINDNQFPTYHTADERRIGLLAYRWDKDCLKFDPDRYKAIFEKQTNLKLEKIKSNKIKEISTSCSTSIAQGFEVKNLGHFSLTETDQLNIASLFEEIKQGSSHILYHADGELCKMFTADEFTLIYDTAMAFIKYHTTLCNHLNVWIRRCKTIDEIESISYTSEFPDELHISFNNIVSNEISASSIYK